MATITRTARIAAPRDVVWDTLTASADWADWTDLSSSVRERDGEGHPDGVGAVRQIWAGGVAKDREEVVTFDADAGIYEYVLLSGLPIKDYRGRAELVADGDHTVVTWTSQGKPPLPIPGADRVNGVAMGLVIGRLLSGLEAEAERRASRQPAR